MVSFFNKTGGFLMRVLGIKKNENAAPERDVRLCVLGLDNAGKTTILRALAHEEINTVQPT